MEICQEKWGDLQGQCISQRWQRVAPHKMSDNPRRSVPEEKANLRRPWANEGSAMAGEAVRSQKAKGHKSRQWFITPSWKPCGLDLVQPSPALCASGDTPWSYQALSLSSEPSGKMERGSAAVIPSGWLCFPP